MAFTDMRIVKVAIIAAVGALAVEAALYFLCMVNHVGGDGADAVGWIAIILLYPAEFVSRYFPTTGDIVFFLAGFIQFFLIFVLALSFWSFKRARARRVTKAHENAAS